MHTNEITEKYQIWVYKGQTAGWVDVTGPYFRQELIVHPTQSSCALSMRSPGGGDFDPTWVSTSSALKKENLNLGAFGYIRAE